jgi:hypothetical protein
VTRISRWLVVLVVLALGGRAANAWPCAPAPCSCKPCSCEKGCSCDPCTCEKCPARAEDPGLMSAVMGRFLIEAVGQFIESMPLTHDESPISAMCGSAAACARPACPANGCAMPHPCPLAPSGAAMPMPEPLSMVYGYPLPNPCPPARQYEVQARLISPDPMMKSCPQVRVCEHNTASVALGAPAVEPGCMPRVLDIQVAGREKGTVSVNVGLEAECVEECDPEGQHWSWKAELAQVCRTVPLEKPTTLVLFDGKSKCGPCAVELTVKEVKGDVDMPNPCFPPPMTCPCPCPPPAFAGACPPCAPSCPCPVPMPPCCYQVAPPCVMPAPVAQPAPASSPVMPCVARVPAEKPGSDMCIVQTGCKSRVQMTSPDGTCTCCARMTMKTSEAGAVMVAAGKKQVHLSGAVWKACADAVHMTPAGHVVLTGHVRLTCEKAGVCAKLKAERVEMDLRHGHVKLLDTQGE